MASSRRIATSTRNARRTRPTQARSGPRRPSTRRVAGALTHRAGPRAHGAAGRQRRSLLQIARLPALTAPQDVNAVTGDHHSCHRRCPAPAPGGRPINRPPSRRGSRSAPDRGGRAAIGGTHRPSARRLDLGQLQRAAVAVEQQPVALGASRPRRPARASAVDAGARSRRGSRRRAAAGARRCAGERAHGARAPPAFGRVERAVLGRDLVRVGDAAPRLLDRTAGARRAPDQSSPPSACSRGGERAVVVVGLDRLARLQADRARSPSRPSGRMIDTPVRSSPAMIARSIGAAPRQRGSSDGCTLNIS